ncbi:unnamed protein product, partial [Amoebophrya sp. A25]
PPQQRKPPPDSRYFMQIPAAYAGGAGANPYSMIAATKQGMGPGKTVGDEDYGEMDEA